MMLKGVRGGVSGPAPLDEALLTYTNKPNRTSESITRDCHCVVICGNNSCTNGWPLSGMLADKQSKEGLDVGKIADAQAPTATIN